jgi:hypothetical protein
MINVTYQRLLFAIEDAAHANENYNKGKNEKQFETEGGMLPGNNDEEKEIATNKDSEKDIEHANNDQIEAEEPKDNWGN